MTGRTSVPGGIQQTLTVLTFFWVHVGPFKPALPLGVVKALASVRTHVTPAA